MVDPEGLDKAISGFLNKGQKLILAGKKCKRIKTEFIMSCIQMVQIKSEY